MSILKRLNLDHELLKITFPLILFIYSGLFKINNTVSLNILKEKLVYNPKMINKLFAESIV